MDDNKLNLLDLPDTILIQILQNLSTATIINVRQTCSRLYQLSFNRKILEQQQFIYDTDFGLSPEQLFELFDGSTEIEFNLQFRGSMPCTSLFLHFLQKHGSRIRSLILDRVTLSFHIILYVMKYCEKLKELRIECCIINENVVNISTKRFFRRKHLETLEIKRCNFKSYLTHTAFFDLILASYPNLKTFSYSFHGNFSERIEMIGSYTLENFILHRMFYCNKMIQNLSMNIKIKDNSSTPIETRDVKNELIKSLTSSPLILQSLQMYLDNNDLVSISAFKNLFCHQTNLKELDIRYHQTFNKEFLEYLLITCPHLEKLYLCGSINLCFEDIMAIINQYGCNIKTLKNPITTFSLNKILKFSDLKFPKLHHIELNLTNIQLSQVESLMVLQSSNLTHLGIICGKISSPTILKNIFEFISAFQNTLVRLELSLLFTAPKTKLENILISKLHFPKLEELDLNLVVFKNVLVFNNNVCQGYANDVLIDQFFGDFNFPCLRKLTIQTPYDLEERHKMFIRGCPFLENLSIVTSHVFNDCTMSNILRRFSPLRSCIVEIKGAIRTLSFRCYDTNFVLVMKKWCEFKKRSKKAIYTPSPKTFLYKIKSTI